MCSDVKLLIWVVILITPPAALLSLEALSFTGEIVNRSYE
jgi:hypothetical protein